MAASHRNTDIRAGAWHALRQLLPATGDHACRRSMHTPAPSRCVLRGTDGRRVGRVNPDQFDIGAEALRFEQLPIFCIEQSQEHACSLGAEPRNRRFFAVKSRSSPTTGCWTHSPASRGSEKSIPITSSPCTVCGFSATSSTARSFSNSTNPAKPIRSPFSSCHCLPAFVLPMTYRP